MVSAFLGLAISDMTVLSELSILRMDADYDIESEALTLDRWCESSYDSMNSKFLLSFPSMFGFAAIRSKMRTDKAIDYIKANLMFPYLFNVFFRYKIH
jgi:hypothetical protein